MTLSRIRYNPRSSPREKGDEHELNRASNLKIGIIGAAATVIAGIIAVFAGYDRTTTVDAHNRTTVINYPNKVDSARKDNRHVTVTPPLRNTPASAHLVPPPAKIAFFGIRTSGDQSAYDLNGKLKELFSARGYEPREAATGKGFENLVAATFRISTPYEQKGMDRLSTIVYPLELTLEFYPGAASTPCERRTYTKNIYGNKLDDKQETIAQGVRELVALVAAEKTFPLCIPKQ